MGTNSGVGTPGFACGVTWSSPSISIPSGFFQRTTSVLPRVQLATCGLISATTRSAIVRRSRTATAVGFVALATDTAARWRAASGRGTWRSTVASSSSAFAPPPFEESR